LARWLQSGLVRIAATREVPLRSLTLGTKVFVLLGLALTFTAVTAVAGLLTNHSINAIVDQYQDEKIPALDVLVGMTTHISEATSQAAAVENQDADEATHAAAIEALRKALKDAQDDAGAFVSYPRSEEEAAAWTVTTKHFLKWSATVDRLASAAEDRASKADDFAKAAAAQHEVSAAFNSFRQSGLTVVTSLDDLAKKTHEAAGVLNAQAAARQRSATGWLVGVFVLAAALLVAGGVYLAASTRQTVAALKREAGRLSDAIAAGRIDVRADPASVGPEFAPIVEGMNDTMGAFERPLRMTVDYVTRIGRGDIPEPIAEPYLGDFDLIKRSLNNAIAAVGNLVADARMLAQAGVEGRLETRADAARHQGDFQRVVQGVNDTLDAVVGPIRVAAETVGALAAGNVPPRITAAYQGDFAALRDDLNRCIDAVNRLLSDANALAEAGAAGRLSTRADASRHQGDFRRIVEGVNRTLDAVIGPLDKAAAVVAGIAAGNIPAPITEQYPGDFSVVRENLNTCIAAVNRLVDDTAGLVKAAAAGRLSHRADASRHQGDFARIVEGVNRTLEAVTAPVQEASAVLERLSEKDLCARVAGDYQGDHARIKEAVNETAHALQDALGQVNRAVEQVSGAAAQIASSSQAVASGASEQASSLEEITASIESVASTAQHSADSAQQANTLSSDARAAAGAGSAAVQQLQGAMEQIRQAADRTGQIIKDVSDIAFQTNLLALNAAVEAARAGDAGRGFAVVAEEVRSLALRAKEAAQKTEDLIRESVKQAGEGQAAAGQVSARLTEILKGVTKVSDIVAEITASAREQTLGIGQVNAALSEMDKVTQQNAASAEESSSAASELNAQAEELAAMVSSFRLADGDNPRARLARPHRNLALHASLARQEKP
jgi:methyl-accepting chemotaxis protein